MEDLRERSVSKGASWAGWVIGVLPSLLLLMSAAMKFFPPTGFDEGLRHLGWDAGKMFYIGIVEVFCAVVYLVPRTAVLGAILITAYMGGAIATHVRVGDMFIVQILIGMLVWLGLYLRDPRLRSLLPIRT